MLWGDANTQLWWVHNSPIYVNRLPGNHFVMFLISHLCSVLNMSVPHNLISFLHFVHWTQSVWEKTLDKKLHWFCCADLHNCAKMARIESQTDRGFFTRFRIANTVCQWSFVSQSFCSQVGGRSSGSPLYKQPPLMFKLAQYKACSSYWKDFVLSFKIERPCGHEHQHKEISTENYTSLMSHQM